MSGKKKAKWVLTFVRFEFLLDSRQGTLVGAPGRTLALQPILQPVRTLSLLTVRQSRAASRHSRRAGTGTETGCAVGGGLLAGETGLADGVGALAFDKVGLASDRVGNDAVCVHSVGCERLNQYAYRG